MGQWNGHVNNLDHGHLALYSYEPRGTGMTYFGYFFKFVIVVDLKVDKVITYLFSVFHD